MSQGIVNVLFRSLSCQELSLLISAIFAESDEGESAFVTLSSLDKTDTTPSFYCFFFVAIL